MSGAVCLIEGKHGPMHQGWAHYPGQLAVWPCRFDKRGRRIGRNWWREMNTQIVRDHNDAVDAIKGTNHQMEPDEFREAHPYLTLKAVLIHNKGLRAAA